MRPPTFVNEPAEIADGATVSSATMVWHRAQVLPGGIVGRDWTLGNGSFIGAGSVLGDGVKVGNYANVFGAQVGDGAFIGPAVLLMEDPAPRSLPALPKP
jgi:UDP-3-O-[3-hydroxymyristoyl] glucosamine N-acyltransferase